MKNPWLGMAVGAGLGVVDGLTAWFTPAVRDQLAGIVAGSVFKDLVVGLIAGLFARKVHSLPMGLLLAGGAGLLFAWLVAFMGDAHGNHYYFAIMLPGGLAGLILGYVTQKC